MTKATFSAKINENEMHKVRKEFHLLEQELLQLQDSGVIPKKKRLNITTVKRKIIALGLQQVNKLSYQEFAKKNRK